MSLDVETIGPAPLDPNAEQVHVRMRDGVRLATDVYLGDDSTPRSAVLVRLPYDKCGRYTFMPQLAPHFTGRGYAFVVQDVRGKFRSGGNTMPYAHEVTDGYDTIDWIVSQPWCDGSVGMFGDSYYGYTQWAAVASGHPALRAIVPRVTSADIAVNRTQWAGTVAPLYGADYLAHYWVDQPIYEYEVDWAHRPLAEVFDDAFAMIGTRAAAFDVALKAADDPRAAGPRWRQHPFDLLRIPVLHSVGWFDNIAPESMRDYTTLTGRADTAGLQYLVADATDHENYQLSDIPIGPATDHDQDAAALQRLIPVYLGPALDFFDQAVRGRGDLAGLPRVRWRMGHEGWHETATWPPPGARELRLYLAGGRATADAEGGSLARRADSAKAAVHWTHDPDNLVPSTVTDPFAFLREFPDEQTVQARPDVLTFTAEPFSRPLDLAGPARLWVRVGSSATSMHLHAKLADVAPDGSARMLVRGQAHVQDPHPGETVEISLGHTGYRLQAGHRLRVHLACSDYPLYIWHPGTGENPWQAIQGKRNEQTLVTGGSAPSHLSITVLGDA
jgi:putative CocE/NonD family hydrolase